MSKQKIKELLRSGGDEKEIARELSILFVIHPELIELRYNSGKTIFHLLVIKNKPLILQSILEDDTWQILQTKPWQEIAACSDDNGWTLIHHAAQLDENGRATMDVVLRFFPNKINAQNAEGNTPLHVGVEAQRLWAVKTLVQHDCDRSIKNNHNQTALELPQVNSELRFAFLAIDLGTISSLDLRYRTKAQSSSESEAESSSSLRESCPLLSSGRSSDRSLSSSSSIDSPHTPLRHVEQSASESSLSEAIMALESHATIENKSALRLMSSLCKAHQTNKQSFVCVSLHNELIRLLNNGFLADDFAFDQKSPLNKPANRKIIQGILNELYARIEELNSYIQRNTSALIGQSLRMIATEISIADSEPLTPQTINTGQKKTDELMENLWLLTACQTSHHSKRKFNFLDITHRAVGILSSASLHDILVNLETLYPDFDKDQKIVTNFVLLQLLNYNVINTVRQDENIATQIRLFAELNTNIEKGLGALGASINQSLFKIHELCSLYSKNPLLRNFYILNRAINQPEGLHMLPAFDATVDQALGKTRPKRTAEVGIIAHELRMLTIAFYQSVSISEFHNKNWEKEDVCSASQTEGHACTSQCIKTGKTTRSPHITEFTDFFNKLSNYFVVKTVTQSPKNIKNALQLLIEIAQALCPLDDENYPDINHLMVISSIFNNVDVSRLVNFNTDLSVEDNAYRQEIDNITSREKNYRMMRRLYQQFRTTLPFLGIFCRDLTFASDGNEQATPIIRAEACGSILKSLLEVKLLLNFEPINFSTNLRLFLKNYLSLDEEIVHSASLRIKPRKTDTIHWEHSLEAIISNLNVLNTEYLTKDIIPSISMRKTKYSPKKLPIFLMDTITSLVKSYKKRQEKNNLESPCESSQELLSLLTIISKLSIALPQLIRINQMYYKPEQLTGMKSLISILIKLDELKKSIQPPMPLLPKEGLPARPISRNNSFLAARSPFIFERTRDESAQAASSSDESPKMPAP
ncbi:RasGEF domain-containing protein [Legionella worsleiensis]|uniref:RasGEF domain protein n=1 Tax=Legionella worsleiensis TaxID=45076 RepID=A0A0W1A6Y4_9GAMM|nr:RasGEF domain-containing protein [Legionella worsleiensis]KTD76787.1 RasGEF domain protein [Legionella worsleiensis]STY30615.1 RasGEF domain [Legionella worsleiensis]